MQNRFKSKTLWVGIVAQIVSLLIFAGFINTGLGAEVNSVAGIVFQLLATFGILNNPTNPTGF